MYVFKSTVSTWARSRLMWRDTTQAVGTFRKLWAQEAVGTTFHCSFITSSSLLRYFVITLRHYTSLCHFIISLQFYSSLFHFVVSLRHFTSSCHFVISLHFPMFFSLRHVTSSLHFVVSLRYFLWFALEVLQKITSSASYNAWEAFSCAENASHAL